MDATTATKEATIRLATLGSVTACAVRRSGDWWVVDAKVYVSGLMMVVFATAPTLDAALAHVGA